MPWVLHICSIDVHIYYGESWSRKERQGVLYVTVKPGAVRKPSLMRGPSKLKQEPVHTHVAPLQLLCEWVFPASIYVTPPDSFCGPFLLKSFGPCYTFCFLQHPFLPLFWTIPIRYQYALVITHSFLGKPSWSHILTTAPYLCSSWNTYF
jgi:hypothetical protein